MTDEQIVALYFERNEEAIRQTKIKYSRYLLSVAENILPTREDAEECENSTYLAAWNSIPPHKPKTLSTYLGKIIRHLAIKAKRAQKADKRGGGEASLSFDELSECIPASFSMEDSITDDQLATIISAFLRTLPETERRLFICRYFHCDSIAVLSETFGMKESRVKTTLMRTRGKLAAHLTEKGVLL